MLLNILLFGSDKYIDTVKMEILVHAVNFLKTTKRFNPFKTDKTPANDNFKQRLKWKPQAKCQ